MFSAPLLQNAPMPHNQPYSVWTGSDVKTMEVYRKWHTCCDSAPQNGVVPMALWHSGQRGALVVWGDALPLSLTDIFASYGLSPLAQYQVEDLLSFFSSVYPKNRARPTMPHTDFLLYMYLIASPSLHEDFNRHRFP